MNLKRSKTPVKREKTEKLELGPELSDQLLILAHWKAWRYAKKFGPKQRQVYDELFSALQTALGIAISIVFADWDGLSTEQIEAKLRLSRKKVVGTLHSTKEFGLVRYLHWFLNHVASDTLRMMPVVYLNRYQEEKLRAEAEACGEEWERHVVYDIPKEKSRKHRLQARCDYDPQIGAVLGSIQPNRIVSHIEPEMSPTELSEIAAEARKRCVDAIDRMIVDRFLEGQKTKQVAAQVGLGVQAVRRRKNRLFGGSRNTAA